MPGTNFILVTETEHASTLNALAAEGKILPVGFTLPDGTYHRANSMWAASEWLISHGYRSSDYMNVEFKRQHIIFDFS